MRAAWQSYLVWLSLSACLWSYAWGLTCYSCFLACKTAKNCDCTEGVCTGPYCYSRVTAYNGDDNYAVHKGCASHFHGPPTDCVIDNFDSTSDCLCNSTDYCNSGALINTAKNAHLQECCEKTMEDTELCPKTCQGTYCYDDQVTGEKGCGAARSEMLRNLRIFDLDSVADKRVCGKLWYDDVTRVLHNGCICKGPKCNAVDLDKNPPSYSRAKHQCNSCQSTKDFTEGESTDSCTKGNNTCWGNLCFVHYKTEQFSQFYDEEYDQPGPPTKEDTQALTFGCVQTDKPQSAQIGCSSEWTSGEMTKDGDNKMSVIECICDSKLCNHKDLLSIRFDQTTTTTASSPTSSPSSASVTSTAQDVSTVANAKANSNVKSAGFSLVVSSYRLLLSPLIFALLLSFWVPE